MTKNKNPIIGVTEAGDAGLDLSWAQRMSEVDGAIIITKAAHKTAFQKALLPFADKCILHATMTGLGPLYEPNVENYVDVIGYVHQLVRDGFPREHVVIRVDPIIPTKVGLTMAAEVFDAAYRNGFRRFRISVLDMYPHVAERFTKLGLKLPYTEFQAPEHLLRNLDEMLAHLKADYPGIVVEACAEHGLKNVRHCGCLSGYDMDILGIDYDEDAATVGCQRAGCSCLAFKKELLSHRTPCPHQCVYCYWKD